MTGTPSSGWVAAWPSQPPPATRPEDWCEPRGLPRVLRLVEGAVTMTAAGVAKLIEECAELQIELGSLQQILAKKLAYWHTDEHPDGKGSINQRIEDEMGDVIAAVYFVRDRLGLDREVIAQRMMAKLELFGTWEAQIDNNDLAIDRRTP